MIERRWNKLWYQGLLFAEEMYKEGQSGAIAAILLDYPDPFIEGAVDYMRHRSSNPIVFSNT